jgi:hypothetical protein
MMTSFVGDLPILWAQMIEKEQPLLSSLDDDIVLWPFPAK